MADGVDQAVGADEFSGEGVEGDVLVEGQQVVEPLLPHLGHRQPQHRQQDKHAAEVQALA